MKREAAAAHADAGDYDDYTRDKGVWLAGIHARLDDPATRARDRLHVAVWLRATCTGRR